MDLRMPRLDGAQAALRIRGEGGVNAHTPIIAFSADARPGGPGGVFDGAVSKPMTAAGLIEALNLPWPRPGSRPWRSRRDPHARRTSIAEIARRLRLARIAPPFRRPAMSDELVFYTNPMSRGRIARWMLEEVGAAYRTVVLDYASTMKAPEYLAVNPMGKVPAITHRGVTVTEGAAICAYLADAFPRGRPGPAGHLARARDLLSLADVRLRPRRGGGDQQVHGLRRARRSQGVHGGYGCLEDTLNALETAVSGRPTSPATGSRRPTSMSAHRSAGA
jgi:CheY-like chemotaxis protein